MSVTIRLSRIGRKNQPAYKLVVSNTRDKRNGKFVDILGFYNPYESVNKFSYDKDKFEKWTKRGALVTDAVKKLIEGSYEYVKYEPKKVEKKERSEESKQQQASTDQLEETEEKTETETQEEQKVGKEKTESQEDKKGKGKDVPTTPEESKDKEKDKKEEK